MKRYMAVGCMAAWLACVAFSGAQAAEEKIVFVNMDRIFNAFYKTKLADTQLKEQASQVMEERKKLQGDFDKLQADFNKLRDDAQNTALTEEVRGQRRSAAEEKLVEVRDYEQKVRRFDETRRKQMEDQSRRMRKRLVDEIRDAIQTYARNQMFSAVLDVSGQTLNGIETVIYTEPRIDITGEITDVLNRTRPADLGAKTNETKAVTTPAIVTPTPGKPAKTDKKK
ncbi:MAG: OmpH family outer membrane protein [Kiritimatiellaeota bacterium]|nr:OmpH family outer membrane protein [Kiritimatiellota bacterium]